MMSKLLGAPLLLINPVLQSSCCGAGRHLCSALCLWGDPNSYEWMRKRAQPVQIVHVSLGDTIIVEECSKHVQCLFMPTYLSPFIYPHPPA